MVGRSVGWLVGGWQNKISTRVKGRGATQQGACPSAQASIEGVG